MLADDINIETLRHCKYHVELDQGHADCVDGCSEPGQTPRENETDRLLNHAKTMRWQETIIHPLTEHRNGAKGKRGKKGKGTKDKGQMTKGKDTKTQRQKTQGHKAKAKIESHKAKGLDARPESRTQDAGRKGRTQDTQLQDKCKNGEVTMRVPWRDADDEEQSRRWRQVADSASQIPGRLCKLYNPT